MTKKFMDKVQDSVEFAGKWVYNGLTGGLASDIYNSAIGVDLLTGQKLSATERVISGASAALFFSPVLEEFVLTSNTVKSMRVLNIGSGTNPIRGAININNVMKDGVDLVADVTKKLPFDTGSIDSIISINPYGYNPLNAATNTVLKEGGTFTIVGQTWNKYFNNIYKASSEALKQMGYEVVSRGAASDAYKFGTQTTNGNPIDPDTLFQIILRKI
ncbi:pre-toxin TG domain-containing protein [Cohnella sp. AR92]|uniref:pre-toxin TG domain-containing protein n=1 Tax=Cohnella sp. AR92 TaxID=648716 RepID=UPI000F8DEC20|nr:pre-toxin TG domain-containing protein [Cohnella sp. AR92]RUS43558.1 hypothetical protein ELR57_24840 [Cohnella sp. AR92]